jgi:hypothetical protein
LQEFFELSLVKARKRSLICGGDGNQYHVIKVGEGKLARVVVAGGFGSADSCMPR